MTNEELKRWLETLRVGDRVVVSYSSSRAHDVIRTVSAIHKIHIVVGHTKYRKIDGRSAGRDAWHWSDIGPVTDQIRGSIAVRNARQALARDVPKLTDAEAIRIAAIVRDALKTEAPK